MRVDDQALLRLEAVSKSFAVARGVVPVLRKVNLALGAGDFGVITGPSGSGKTTLLMVAGLLQSVDSGRVWFAGRETAALAERDRAELRKQGVGVVFQKFDLLPHRTALENVEFRFRYLPHSARDARRMAEGALAQVGLADQSGLTARLLSAGEMQRVAIARALALPPRVLLADEPTGNLDPESAAQVMSLFSELNRAGMTILLVTHNLEWTAGRATHWRLHQGELAAVPARHSPKHGMSGKPVEALH